MKAPSNNQVKSPSKIIPGAACIGFLVLWSALLLIPTSLRTIHERKTLNGLQETLAARETLFPFYARIKSEAPAELSGQLRKDEAQAIARNEISELAAVFSAMAADAGIEMRSATPTSHTIETGLQFLQVQVKATGRFEDFQSFMLAITRIPSFIHLVETQVLKGDFGEELDLTFWLNID